MIFFIINTKVSYTSKSKAKLIADNNCLDDVHINEDTVYDVSYELKGIEMLEEQEEKDI